MKLAKYKMDEEEWEIAHQLKEVLKVSLDIIYLCSLHLSAITQVFKDVILFFLQDGIQT